MDLNKHYKTYDHHNSVGDLEKSADNGCEFCRFIVDCIERAQFGEIQPRPGAASVDVDEDWDRDFRSRYPVAKEMDEPSNIRLAISSGMRRSMYSSEPDGSGRSDVYETLRVHVGQLYSIKLNLIASRGKKERIRRENSQ